MAGSLDSGSDARHRLRCEVGGSPQFNDQPCHAKFRHDQSQRCGFDRGDVAALAEFAGLALGGMASAIYGVRLVRNLSSEWLVRLIACLLVGIGALLLWEVAFPFKYTSLLPTSVAAHLSAGIAIGVGIGIVSSVLGVAGGELLIPTLIFVFGVDIRIAGSASILISLGIVLMGL